MMGKLMVSSLLKSGLNFSRVAALKAQAIRRCNTRSRKLVLGIETSCDDTGAAVVDDEGHILGEALHSQQQVHLDNGGIIPPIARDLHQQHIAQVVSTALHNANINLQDVDAIATTVKPGLALSLLIGMNYGKKLAKEASKPFIPIHHMEAHALTIRILEKIPFPFLTLLISGGHCILSVVKSVDEFIVLGKSLDDAPGEAFDKVARRLKLKNLPEYSAVCGGESIELAARKGNPLAFNFPVPLSTYRNCSFSFAGLKNNVRKCTVEEEVRQDVAGGNVLPNVADICASFQWILTKHLLVRIHRAIIYAERENLIPNTNRTLVVSGGVASNQFIRTAIDKFCSSISYSTAYPTPKLCSDNGVMIAWNGMERLLANSGVTTDLDTVDIQPQCPLGVDHTWEVFNKDIILPKFRFRPTDVVL